MAKKKRGPIALQLLQVEYNPPSEIKPNDYNPNRQTEDEFAMLLASMREDGFTTPIIITEDGTIVDGEHRWRAAQELGYEKVPVVRVSMTEAQRRIATMRHNRARGQDDTAAVAELMLDLEKLGALDWAQEALLLSDEEMRRLTAMADTVAEDLSRGHEFSQAWEPVERTEYQPPDKPGMPVSYSWPVSATSQLSVAAGEEPSSANIPGQSESEIPQKPDPEPMTRRQFVITLSEAAIVDRVLGELAATRLVQLCQEAENHGW
jgi:ParB-like chromosome segregation protein Spo0J